MRSKQFFTFLILVFFSTVLLITIHANASPSKYPPCEKVLLDAASNFVYYSFGDRKSIWLPAFNDIGCEKVENMANVVIVIGNKDGWSHYGIFHIHFKDDGKFVTAAAFTDWKILESRDKKSDLPASWKTDWCNIIRSVYPKEIQEQKC